MRRIIIMIGLISCLKVSFAQNRVAGLYRDNFASYGMFGKTLQLNCDSSAVLIFAGDLMRDSSFAYWKVDKNLLILTFDSTKRNKQRYKGASRFIIKHHRLYNVPFTREIYNNLKKTADSLHIKEFSSYQAYLKILNCSPKNFYGKMGTQYLEMKQRYDCKE
jgi:hypothetical protein